MEKKKKHIFPCPPLQLTVLFLQSELPQCTAQITVWVLQGSVLAEKHRESALEDWTRVSDWGSSENQICKSLQVKIPQQGQRSASGHNHPIEFRDQHLAANNSQRSTSGNNHSTEVSVWPQLPHQDQRSESSHNHPTKVRGQHLAADAPQRSASGLFIEMDWKGENALVLLPSSPICDLLQFPKPEVSLAELRH